MKPVSTVIGILIMVILFSAVLVPVVSTSGHVTEVAVAENQGEDYLVDTKIGDGLAIELSDGAVVNGEQVALKTANPGVIVRSDKFVAIWYRSQTTVTVSDVQLGAVSNVVAITVNADGTYGYTKNDDSVVNAPDALNKIYYPSNTGDYGAFTNPVINVDVGDKWLGQFPNIAMSPWYLAVIEFEGDKSAINVTESKIIDGASVYNSTSAINYTTVPTDSSDGLSFIISNLSVTRSTEYEGNTYATAATPQIIAPMEYHYLDDVEVAISLFGIIPVLVAVAIVLTAVGLICNRWSS